jgi:hypothetical protein
VRARGARSAGRPGGDAGRSFAHACRFSGVKSGGAFHRLERHDRVRVGSLELSLGNLLAFGITLWISIVLAQLVRFFLQEGLAERGLARGVPTAISRTAFYVLVGVGGDRGGGRLGDTASARAAVAAAGFPPGPSPSLQPPLRPSSASGECRPRIGPWNPGGRGSPSRLTQVTRKPWRSAPTASKAEPAR